MIIKIKLSHLGLLTFRRRKCSKEDMIVFYKMIVLARCVEKMLLS